MNPLYDRLDIHRVFTTYPLPKKYQNNLTNIKIVQFVSNYEFGVIVVNPNLPPLRLNLETNKWEKQQFGLPETI